MASFTFAELRVLWVGAGGPESQADVAAAIALAESTGCQYALAAPVDVRPVSQCTYRNTSQEFSVGLWQINIMAHRQYSSAFLFNPANNARAAVSVSTHGTDFGPWSTYKNGSYLAHMPHGPDYPGAMGPTVAINKTRSTRSPGATGPIGVNHTANALTGWGHLMSALGKTIPTQSKRARRARNRFTKAVR